MAEAGRLLSAMCFCPDSGALSIPACLYILCPCPLAALQPCTAAGDSFHLQAFVHCSRGWEFPSPFSRPLLSVKTAPGSPPCDPALWAQASPGLTIASVGPNRLRLPEGWDQVSANFVAQ